MTLPVMRAAVPGLLAFLLNSCASDTEAGQTTRPPQFIDAASDARVEPTLCNLNEPQCPPALPKCTVVQRDDRYVSECVPESGALGVGESCQRAAVGHDDCGAGNLCSTVVLPGEDPATLACRKLCSRAEHCSAPERCYRFSNNQPEVYGVCVAQCEPLGLDCGTGRHCVFVRDASSTVFGLCDDHGDVPEGVPCNSPYECSKGLACAFEDGCRVYCDATHPCADSGRTCFPLNFPEFPGLGLCMPGTG